MSILLSNNVNTLLRHLLIFELSEASYNPDDAHVDGGRCLKILKRRDEINILSGKIRDVLVNNDWTGMYVYFTHVVALVMPFQISLSICRKNRPIQIFHGKTSNNLYIS